MGAAVERPDGLRDRLKEDVVGAGSSGNGCGDGEGGAVECNYCVGATVSDVAELAGGVESDGVDAVEVRNDADGFTSVCVDDVNFGAVGDVKAMRAGVGDRVVPAAVTADLPVVDDAVRLSRPRGRGRGGGCRLLRGEEGWWGGDDEEEGGELDCDEGKVWAGHAELLIKFQRGKDSTQGLQA